VSQVPRELQFPLVPGQMGKEHEKPVQSLLQSQYVEFTQIPLSEQLVAQYPCGPGIEQFIPVHPE